MSKEKSLQTQFVIPSIIKHKKVKYLEDKRKLKYLVFL